MEVSETQVRHFVRMYEIQKLRLIWNYGNKQVEARIMRWFTRYGEPALAELKKGPCAHLVEGLSEWTT